MEIYSCFNSAKPHYFGIYVNYEFTIGNAAEMSHKYSWKLHVAKAFHLELCIKKKWLDANKPVNPKGRGPICRHADPFKKWKQGSW